MWSLRADVEVASQYSNGLTLRFQLSLVVKSPAFGSLQSSASPLSRLQIDVDLSENDHPARLFTGFVMPDRSTAAPRQPDDDRQSTRDRIIEQARQLEIDFFYSAKSHYKLALYWDKFAFWLGLASVVVSAVGGLISLTKDGPATWLHSPVLVGVAAIFVSCLTAIVTFTKAGDKANLHKVAGNRYNTLRDKTRQFYSVECFMKHTNEELWKMLEKLTSDKDKTNSESPPIPEWAYKIVAHSRPRAKFEESQFAFMGVRWNDADGDSPEPTRAQTLHVVSALEKERVTAPQQGNG